MHWEIEFLPEGGVVRATLQGRHALQEITGLITESMRAARKHRADRLLIDCTRMTPDLATAEIYRLPELAQAAGMHRYCHVAIVLSDHRQRADFEFYETRAHNLGYDHRLFASVQEALAWLVPAGG